MSEEMDASEVAALFGEPVPVEKVEEFPEENIYAISARIKNEATLAANHNLTPAGVQLCNCYTHVIASLYNFANSLQEPDRERLKVLIRKHEAMPAEFIAAAPVPERKRPEPLPVSSEGQSSRGLGDLPIEAILRAIQQRDQAVRETEAPFWDPPVPKKGLFERLFSWLFPKN